MNNWQQKEEKRKANDIIEEKEYFYLDIFKSMIWKLFYFI